MTMNILDSNFQIDRMVGLFATRSVDLTEGPNLTTYMQLDSCEDTKLKADEF